MTVFLGQKINVFLQDGVKPSDFQTRRILIAGIKDALASHVSGTLAQDISLDIETIRQKFGLSSHIGQKLLRYMTVFGQRFIENKPSINVFALDNNAAGAAATATMTITGTASQDCTITLFAGDYDDYTIDVDIKKGQTAADIANTIANRFSIVDDFRNSMPFVATVSSAVVTLTSLYKSDIANKMQIGITSDLSNYGFQITLTGFTSGAGTYDIADLTTEIEELQFDYYDIDKELVESSSVNFYDFLKERVNVTGSVRSGLLFSAVQDSVSNIIDEYDYSSGSNADAANNRLFAPIWLIEKSASNIKGNALSAMPSLIGSSIVAMHALLTTENANTAGYTTNASQIVTGGLQYLKTFFAKTPFSFLKPRKNWSNGMSRAEANQLLDRVGGVFLEIASETGMIVASESYTTQKKDVSGNAVGKKARLSFMATNFFFQKFLYSKISDSIPPEATFTSGTNANGKDIFNSTQIINLLNSFLTMLATRDDVNDVDLYLIANDNKLFNAQQTLERTLKFSNGQITAQVMPKILALIDGITINIFGEYDN